jgi:hypothetical protein
MSRVRVTFPSLAPPPRALASHRFSLTLYIVGSSVAAAPVDRVVGSFGGSILRHREASPPFGRRAASPPPKIQSA